MKIDHITYPEVMDIINSTIQEYINAEGSLFVPDEYDKGFINALNLIKTKINLRVIQNSEDVQ